MVVVVPVLFVGEQQPLDAPSQRRTLLLPQALHVAEVVDVVGAVAAPRRRKVPLVEDGHEAGVDDLRRHGTVREEETGAEGGRLLLDLRQRDAPAAALATGAANLGVQWVAVVEHCATIASPSNDASLCLQLLLLLLFSVECLEDNGGHLLDEVPVPLDVRQFGAARGDGEANDVGAAQ